MSDIENLSDTVIPKSDQLNADDLAGITRVLKVTSVKRGATKEQPVVVEYSGMDGRPYKPCKTVRRVLIAAWGEDGREWIGRSMKLYCDPEIKYGGVKVGGIRISQLSHIERDLKLLLTWTRGKREETRITRLTTYPQVAFDNNFAKWVEAMKAGKLDLETLMDKVSIVGILTENQITQLKKEIEND